MIYLSTAIGLTPGDSVTVNVYTQTIHRTTQIQTVHKTTQIQTIHRTTQIQTVHKTTQIQKIHRTTQIQTIHRTTQITTILEECGPCLIFASFTPAFSLQQWKRHGKTSFRTNSDLCHLQHKLISFYNRGKCLQRGTDWVFK